MEILKQRKFWLEHFHDEKYEVIRNKIQETFKDLVFDEIPHKYYLHGRELECVSNITHLFVPHFDTDGMAQATYERNFNNEKSKYYQMTPEMIKESWKKISDEACSTGTDRHNFGESVFWWMVGEYDKIVPEFKDRFTIDENGERICTSIYDKEDAVVKFWKDLPDSYIPILAENKVFNVNNVYAYSGTFDILFYYDAEINGRNEETGGLVCLDYKGLSLDTEILTINGWKTMGTLTLNDIVFDKNGRPCKIKHISEIHNNPCYKIKFDNNDEIVCDMDHRWEVSFSRSKRRFVSKVMTCDELAEYIKKMNRKHCYEIPKIINPKPCIYNNGENNLLIDPYVLGVWLGDGHSSCGMVTNMYPEIYEEIHRRGFEIGEDVSQNGAGKATSRTIYGLSTLLKKYNLINNKHIPYEYLISNYKVKLELLRGLMDTDGYYNKKRNRFVLSTTREQQVDFCVKLLSSMGVKASVLKCLKYCNGKKIHGYDITFWIDDYPFLKRKIEIKLAPKGSIRKYRTIKTIEKVDTVPTKCIEVDSETHTYLCGRSLIPTHNTNKDLYKNFNEEKMLEPFNDLLNMSLNVYKLQLAAYQLCLEKIGLNVIARRLIWLRPSGNYEKIPLEDLTKKLDKALKWKFKQQ